MNKIFTVFFLMVLLISCAVAQPNVAGEKTIGIIVSILPLSEFVEKVGGDRVSVTVMVPPGASPHVYEPTPNQLKALSKAQMYVKVGSGIEFELAWLDKIRALNRNMIICDSSKGITLLDMKEEHQCSHHHHSGAKDPHIWLSLNNAIIMAGNIRDALIDIDPQNEEFYTANASKCILDLYKLKKKIRKKLANVSGGKFMVFHPAWGYFAADFDLKQIPVESGGKEPSARDLAGLIKVAKENNIKVVFASPQFSEKSAKVIAREIGGEVLPIDPLAKDYLKNMRNVTDVLTEYLK